jgi:predicted neuraminidase
MSKYLMLFITILLVGCDGAENKNAAKDAANGYITTVQYDSVLRGTRAFAQCHASTMTSLRGGGFLIAWFAGTEEKNDDVSIWVADGSPGKWSPPRVAAKLRHDAHWNPVLFNTPDGIIYLFFKVGKEIDNWETWVQHSSDDGKTWSKAVELVANDQGGRGPVRNQPIVLSDGSWLAPSSIEHREVWNAFTDRSTDNGISWKKSDTLQIDRSKITGSGIIQPALWESRPGHVHMLLRSSTGRICRSDSEDYGQTWSAVYTTDLPNNNSGIDVAHISGDTIALIYNPVSENWGDRYPISIAVSTDNGTTWPTKFDIEKGSGDDELSYPDLMYNNGYLIACYTWNRKNIAFWKGKMEIK